MSQFIERDLSSKYISMSYQDVLQQYVNTSSYLYVLDGYGNVVFGIPSSSVGGIIFTGNSVVSCSWASKSLNSDAADFALLAGDAITATSASYALGCDFALLAGDAITATSSSYALSASWAPGISGGGGLETGSTYPITSSYAISASWAPGGGGTSLETGSTYPITASHAISSSYAPFTPTGLETGSTYPITSSWSENSISASYVDSSNIANLFLPLEFVYKNATGASDPGTGNFRYDSLITSSINYVFINSTTSNGLDVSRIFLKIVSGSNQLYIQQKTDASRASLLSISGTPTDNGGWFTIPVLQITSSLNGLPENNKPCAFVIFNDISIRTGETYPITSSWAVSASNAVSASYAPFTPVGLETGSTYPITSSEAISASYAPFVPTGLETGSTYPITASWAENIPFVPGTMDTGSTYPITTSFSISASYAPFIPTGLETGSSYPITSSWSEKSVTSSYSETASISLFSDSSNYAIASATSDYSLDGLFTLSASYARTSSYSSIATTSSYTKTASYLMGGTRELLTADRTYYVHPTGSNSNDGLTSTNAFQTIQYAIDLVSGLDMGINSTTIQLTNEAYTGSLTVNGLLSSNKYPLKIIGDETAPRNTIIKGDAGAVTFTLNNPSSTVVLAGVELQGDVAGSHLTGITTGATLYFNNISFGYCIPLGRQLAAYGHAKILLSGSRGNYFITTGSNIHIYTTQNSIVQATNTRVTMSSGVGYAHAYIVAALGGVAQYNANTFSGSATGQRYNVSSNAVVFIGAAGETYLPGNIAGATGSGGQYV